MLVMAMAARRQIGRATWFRRPGERVRRLGIEGRQVVLGEPRGVDPQAGKVGVLCAQVFQSHQRLHAFEGQLDLPSQAIGRSEEHTSELQSLMRISYAVFCLKKKKNRHKQGKLKRTK